MTTIADTFGLRLGIEGEKDFKNALRDINQSFKVLGSEMALVTSQFDKNDKSIDALTARNEVLNKGIDEQKNKITTLKAALDNAASSFGENDRRTQNWQIQLNKAKAELNGMERELGDNENALDKLGDEFDYAENEAKDFGKELTNTADKADDAGSRFEKVGGVLKGIGVAMGGAVAMAGAAAVKLGTEVVKSFGELEQNLGGSEAVFGKYADSIKKTGEDAYKNMGTSQSDYLATANKMGALFQGSGVEQQKSLELTEKAMQRAADMASVMGIDMQMALDSVAGAAKGNFTMMDNLGVAMNATNIEAYALAKGLDFTWNTATQAEKAEIAMQMFFENTEQYAGNFAKESTETISGSLGLMQAATSSFVAGLGNADADMIKLTGNMVDAFQAVVKNIVPVIENIVTAIPTALDGILNAVGELLPTLLQTITSLFSQVLETILKSLPKLIPTAVSAVMTIVGTIIDNLPLLINAAVQLVTSLVQGLAEALPLLIPSAVEAVVTIVNGLIESLPLLLDVALQLILGLAEGLLNAIPQLIKALPAIINALLEFIIGAIPQIIEAGIQLLTSLISALPDIISAIVKVLPQIITGIVNALLNSIPVIINAGIQLLVALISDLPTIIVEIVKAIPQIIGGIVTGILGFVPTLGEVGLQLIQGLWQGISDAGAWLSDKIGGFFGGVVDSIKDFFGIASPSKLFAELGGYMGEGLGLGFEKEMDKVGEDMKNAIPSDFDMNLNGAVNGILPSTGASSNAVNVTIPLTIDGTLLARVLSQIEWNQSTVTVRNLGVSL